MSIECHRRYCLLKSRAADSRREGELAAAWRAKQAAAPGAALAAGFPYRARLVAAGYSTLEDLVGLDADELRGQGFTIAEAQVVLTALED